MKKEEWIEKTIDEAEEWINVFLQCSPIVIKISEEEKDKILSDFRKAIKRGIMEDYVTQEKCPYLAFFYDR